jgi:hypothetical protein
MFLIYRDYRLDHRENLGYWECRELGIIRCTSEELKQAIDEVELMGTTSRPAIPFVPTAMPKREEIVRVVRVLEYVGPRSWIDRTMERNAVTPRGLPNGLQVTVGTIREIAVSEPRSTPPA